MTLMVKFTELGLKYNCYCASVPGGSTQIPSELSTLLNCIIQHVLLKPVINKSTASDSQIEPELPNSNLQRHNEQLYLMQK